MGKGVGLTNVFDSNPGSVIFFPEELGPVTCSLLYVGGKKTT